MVIDILFEDEHIIAVNKPPGILVHRTPISEDKVFLMQQLRDQVGYKIYTVHRLDRGSSGVLIFGKYSEICGLMSQLFIQRTVLKKYLVVVRGWVTDQGVIDYPLKDIETGVVNPLEAKTAFSCLKRSEINAEIGLRYSTARFSLVEAIPETGRRHQIRKHFAHISHPIIGDKRHGDVKHNSYFRDHFGLERMFLHASSLSFSHPISNNELIIDAPIDLEFQNGLELMELKYELIIKN
jgi:tRNA pseudouridine65 synthase